MQKSILDGKRILVVDDEPDVLSVLEEEILQAGPTCTVDKATSYREASDLLASWTYDLVILDIMGVRGFDLLEIAVWRKLPVVMLTAHAMTPEALKRSFEMKARCYLPKVKLNEIVPFLEDVLKHEYYPAWKLLFHKMKDFFDARFGPDWEKKTGIEWHKWPD